MEGRAAASRLELPSINRLNSLMKQSSLNQNTIETGKTIPFFHLRRTNLYADSPNNRHQITLEGAYCYYISATTWLISYIRFFLEKYTHLPEAEALESLWEKRIINPITELYPNRTDGSSNCRPCPDYILLPVSCSRSASS